MPDFIDQSAGVEHSALAARNLSRWLLLFSIGIVIMVVGATGASIWLQHNEAIAVHQTATSDAAASDLNDGTPQQDPLSIGSADQALDAIGADPNSADNATINPAAAEAARQARARADRPLQVFFVLFGAVSLLAGVAMAVRYISKQITEMEQAKLTAARKNAELEIAHRQLDAALANISLGR